MKMPPAMIGLFLRSSGAPKPVIELVERIQAEGFDAFDMKPATPDDVNWTLFGPQHGDRTGFILRAKSPTSRAVIAIFLEGTNEEFLQGVAGMLDDPQLALPAASA
jgi:hypothetical protein